MQKALVTGATGHIGTCLRRLLLRNGAEVHAVSRTYQSCQADEVCWWNADLRDCSAVRDLLATVKPDLVFHLAGCVTGRRELQFVIPTFEANLVSAVNILLAATEHGCSRIVLAGSLEEPDPGGIAGGPYAASKWASTGYAQMFHELYRTPVVVARIFMVYGPGPQPMHRLVPYVISSLLEGRPPRLTSGKRRVDWIYVDDAAEALVAIAHAPGVEGDTVEVGSGIPISVRTVAARIAELMGASVRPVFGATPDRPMEQERFANVSRTYAQLAWRPSIGLDAGLRATIDWVRTEFGAGPDRELDREFPGTMATSD